MTGKNQAKYEETLRRLNASTRMPIGLWVKNKKKPWFDEECIDWNSWQGNVWDKEKIISTQTNFPFLSTVPEI